MKLTRGPNTKKIPAQNLTLRCKLANWSRLKRSFDWSDWSILAWSKILCQNLFIWIDSWGQFHKSKLSVNSVKAKFMLNFQNERKIKVKVWQNFCWVEFFAQLFSHEIDPWLHQTFKSVYHFRTANCKPTLNVQRVHITVVHSGLPLNSC